MVKFIRGVRVVWEYQSFLFAASWGQESVAKSIDSSDRVMVLSVCKERSHSGLVRPFAKWMRITSSVGSTPTLSALQYI